MTIHIAATLPTFHDASLPHKHDLSPLQNAIKAELEKLDLCPLFINLDEVVLGEASLTALRQFTLVKNLVHLINNCMLAVAKAARIKKKATTYVARHTFSTVLKRAGASTEAIQEALGHTNIKTTESYLDSFDRDTKKQLAQRLT